MRTASDSLLGQLLDAIAVCSPQWLPSINCTLAAGTVHRGGIERYSLTEDRLRAPRRWRPARGSWRRALSAGESPIKELRFNTDAVTCTLQNRTFASRIMIFSAPLVPFVFFLGIFGLLSTLVYGRLTQMNIQYSLFVL